MPAGVPPLQLSSVLLHNEAEQSVAAGSSAQHHGVKRDSSHELYSERQHKRPATERGHTGIVDALDAGGATRPSSARQYGGMMNGSLMNLPVNLSSDQLQVDAALRLLTLCLRAVGQRTYSVSEAKLLKLESGDVVCFYQQVQHSGSGLQQIQADWFSSGRELRTAYDFCAGRAVASD